MSKGSLAHMIIEAGCVVCMQEIKIAAENPHCVASTQIGIGGPVNVHTFSNFWEMYERSAARSY